jgi:hypothetical protein
MQRFRLSFPALPEIMGLERCSLSLVRITEELLGKTIAALV